MMCSAIFFPSSRCLTIWPITVLSVWYEFGSNQNHGKKRDVESSKYKWIKFSLNEWCQVTNQLHVSYIGLTVLFYCRASVEGSSQALQITQGVDRVTQEVYQYTWRRCWKRCVTLVLFSCRDHACFYLSWFDFSLTWLVGILLYPSMITNFYLWQFLFSSDEPILSYQRNSFFPLAEEKRVSNNYMY